LRSLPLALALAAALFAGRAAAEAIVLGPDRIPATLLKPDGAGPFPAVVMMHDCSGLGPRSSGAPGRWADLLLGRGYVILTPDSFSTRGYPNGVCTEASKARLGVRPIRRARDAQAARSHLRTLGFVDPERIGIMGGSHGGSSTLATLLDPHSGFRAGIALYPRCSQFAQLRPAVPLLILIGELDDWTPARDCQPMAALPNVTLKVYPGAHHSFDSPRPERFIAARINPSAPGGRGATTAGNAETWADSIRQVTEFLEKNLKR
jgi:dienelactone hydrolase